MSSHSFESNKAAQVLMANKLFIYSKQLALQVENAIKKKVMFMNHFISLN